MSDIAQTTQLTSGQNMPMPIADWYLFQADRCARLAKATSAVKKRASLQEERKLWLQIAKKVETDKAKIRRCPTGFRRRKKKIAPAGMLTELPSSAAASPKRPAAPF
jgi:hypothetical protein